MDATVKRLVDGLEKVLFTLYATDVELINENLDEPLEEDVLNSIQVVFLTGFLMATVNAYGKFPMDSYESLIKDTRIDVINRAKIILEYIKAKEVD